MDGEPQSAWTESIGGLTVRPREIVRRQMLSGEATTVGDITVTPQSEAVTIRWPSGGLVWNRPVAVIVEREGMRERIRVADVTRIVQLGLLGLTLVFSLVFFWLSVRRWRDQDD